MALTDLQKAQNKAAQKVRDRAYHQRVREQKEALDAVEHDPQIVELRKLYDQANEQEALHREAINAKRVELVRQIEALNAQLSALSRDAEHQVLVQARREASNRWSQAKSAKTKLIEDRFPDLQDAARFSAVAWQPPQKVLDQMEEARRTATLEDAAPKVRKPRV